MYDLSEKTLYKHKASSLYKENKFSNISYKELFKEINLYKKTNSNMVPESDALMFYLVNNIWHTINSRYGEYEDLPDNVYDLVKECNKLSVQICKGVFFHTCLVGDGMLATYLGNLSDSQKDYFKISYGEGFLKYLENKSNRSIDGLNLHQFLGGMSNVYSIQKLIPWGKPYSMIVKTIHKISNGNTSLYAGCDNVWSLCHNGGTIFNKGIGGIYKVSSNFIFDILDVQDSGQIPAWVNENRNNSYVTKKMITLLDSYYKLFPEEKKTFNQKLFKVSYDKRVKKHAAMNAQYKQWWSNIYGNGTANNNVVLTENKVLNELGGVVQDTKINDILIDTFKKNKWF